MKTSAAEVKIAAGVDVAEEDLAGGFEGTPADGADAGGGVELAVVSLGDEGAAPGADAGEEGAGVAEGA